MSAGRFKGVELNSIGKRDSDRQVKRETDKLKRAKRWQYKTPKSSK